MDPNEPIAGGCHCGNFRYTLHTKPLMPGHCHCNNCKTLTGAGHASMFAIPVQAAEIGGETSVYIYESDSGNTIRRHFCPTCGATAHITNSGMPGVVCFTAGSLNNMELFQPEMVVYASCAQAWDVTDPSLPKFPEMPPMPGG